MTANLLQTEVNGTEIGGAPPLTVENKVAETDPPLRDLNCPPLSSSSPCSRVFTKSPVGGVSYRCWSVQLVLEERFN